MWIINTGEMPIEIVSQIQKRWLSLKPRVPVSIPSQQEALDLIRRYASVRACERPEQYFQGRPMKQLVIRDAGIGDLLLLEPILRKIKSRGNIEVHVLTGYPEVFEGNPAIDKAIKLEVKDALPVGIQSEYDASDDLRSYSEVAESRSTKHRTDVYLEKFDIKMEEDEKEPRLFFPADEKPFRFRKGDKPHVGVSLDASHQFRRIPSWRTICQAILDSGKVPVLLGSISDEKGPSGCVDIRGKTTVREMMNVVKQLDAIVASDSGIMHVALTLHIPTVCLFTIITPDLRLRYYHGPREVVTANVECIGCGDYHMIECKQLRAKEGSMAPCQRVPVPSIIEALNGFQRPTPVVLEASAPARIEVQGPKLSLSFMTLNEEKNLPRFIRNVVKDPSIGRVVCVDGGSRDESVKIMRDAGIEVYTHFYDRTYHDAQAMQRNISMSYFRDGDKVIIMDPDEMFSPELSRYLPFLAASDIEYGQISRRTFKWWRDIDDPGRQIKDFPDWQPRFYTWNRRFKFVASPHHQTLNVPDPVKIDKPIIHAECEGKDRDRLERQWSEMWDKTKEVYK